MMLNPKNAWSNKHEYDKTAKKTTKMFQKILKYGYLVLLLKPDLVLINKNKRISHEISVFVSFNHFFNYLVNLCFLLML